jgi:hypothetical protein
MVININYNLNIASVLYSLIQSCGAALSFIPQRIREIGANLYNRMFPTTPVQIELPNTRLALDVTAISLDSTPNPKVEEIPNPSLEKSSVLVQDPAAVRELRQALLSNEEVAIQPLLRNIYKPSNRVAQAELVTQKTELPKTEMPKATVDVPPVYRDGPEGALPTEEQEEELERTPPRASKPSKILKKSTKTNVVNWMNEPTIYGKNTKGSSFIYTTPKQLISKTSDIARGNFEDRRAFTTGRK